MAMSQRFANFLLGLYIGAFGFGCDVEEEFTGERAEEDGDEASALDPQELVSEIELPGPEGVTPVSGGIGPSPLRCCVDCNDKWSGRWDRGTAPNCSARGAKWCHDHNWNFVNAKWLSSCPEG